MMLRAHLLLGLLLTASSSAQAAVGGTYASPLGPIVLKQRGGKVTGVIAKAGGPCGFKKGQKVLTGSLMDDSVTGTLHICSETPGCVEQDAFVVLLVARKGALLSGAVNPKDKKCRLPLEGKGIAFSRQASKGKSQGKSKPVPRAARTKEEKRQEATAKSPPPKGETQVARAEDPPAQAAATPEETPTAQEVNEPFASWNPDTTVSSGLGRQEALKVARQAEPLLTSGQYEAARPLLLEAIRHDPGYAEGYNMMGVTYYARDNYDDALDWYKKALTANPDFGDAYYNIACIYAVEGKKPLALKYLRIALLNGYAQLAAMEKDSDLDSLRDEPEYKEMLALVEGRAAEEPESPAEPAPAASDAGSVDGAAQ